MSEECELTSYGEMVEVIENLPFLVREMRRERRLSMRRAAEETGLSASTFARLESGEHGVSADGLVSLLRWLDRHDQ